MKVEDARAEYYGHTDRASNVARQLAVAGLGIVWVFKVTTGAIEKVPGDLVRPAALLALALFFDLLQYASASLCWGAFSRMKERTCSSNSEFDAPAAINWPAIVFFWLKIASTAVGYGWLLVPLFGR